MCTHLSNVYHPIPEFFRCLSTSLDNRDDFFTYTVLISTNDSSRNPFILVYYATFPMITSFPVPICTRAMLCCCLLLIRVCLRCFSMSEHSSSRFANQGSEKVEICVLEITCSFISNQRIVLEFILNSFLSVASA